MNKILLCVDDEPTGLNIRKVILEQSGYSVLIAENGARGLELFRQHPVAAVVLDYYMPAMDGGMVATAMKSLKPQVPIILLSAYISLPESALAKVDAFITKGQSPSVLLQKVKELVGNGSES
jgi:CheY-like chemotaxis protein